MKITEVTVVVCVKNRKDLIRQTLQSIESQDEVDVRLIVKDGKSTDGTVEEVANYLKNSTITDHFSEKTDSLRSGQGLLLCLNHLPTSFDSPSQNQLLMPLILP